MNLEELQKRVRTLYLEHKAKWKILSPKSRKTLSLTYLFSIGILNAVFFGFPPVWVSPSAPLSVIASMGSIIELLIFFVLSMKIYGVVRQDKEEKNYKSRRRKNEER